MYKLIINDLFVWKSCMAEWDLRLVFGLLPCPALPKRWCSTESHDDLSKKHDSIESLALVADSNHAYLARDTRISINL